VSFPIPEPGLVIRYSYLWERDAELGREEGSKDRPCAIVAALIKSEGQTRVVVLPITHSPPLAGTEAIELPLQIKRSLGLDDQPSWVVVSEGNDFFGRVPTCGPNPAETYLLLSLARFLPGCLQLSTGGFLTG
jgi:hypothetical protein